MPNIDPAKTYATKVTTDTGSIVWCGPTPGNCVSSINVKRTTLQELGVFAAEFKVDLRRAVCIEVYEIAAEPIDRFILPHSPPAPPAKRPVTDIRDKVYFQQ